MFHNIFLENFQANGLFPLPITLPNLRLSSSFYIIMHSFGVSFCTLSLSLSLSLFGWYYLLSQSFCLIFCFPLTFLLSLNLSFCLASAFMLVECLFAPVEGRRRSSGMCSASFYLYSAWRSFRNFLNPWHQFFKCFPV